MMRGMITAAVAALVLSGCGEEAPQQQEERPATLAPGLYQASFTVSALRSTDRTTPATQLKQGDTASASACVAADGTIDPALFAEGEDECTPSSSYARNGRISIQLECRRPGEPGQVMQSVNGTFDASGLRGDVTMSTYFTGQGDYSIARSFTARRTGECPAGGAPGGAGQENAAGANATP